MNFKSLNNLVNDVRAWSQQIDFDYDYIIGVPGSGDLAAHLLSIYTGKLQVAVTNSDKTLIVDDSLLSGKTMAKWKLSYPNAKYGAVYVKPGMDKKLHTHYEILNNPRIFEWNWFKSAHLPHCMIDIDGILCRDPNKKECDYGEKMRNFYLTVKPKIIPRYIIGALVTCRLQKYRSETMEWLANNGIDAKQLIMRESRKQNHSGYKAYYYERSGMRLFIESSRKQAKNIARRTGKPVLCYETMEML